jgi:hypothetical protein
MSDGGKGDARRPGDDAAFADSYSRIFGDHKPKRGRYIWDDSKKMLVHESEYAECVSQAHMVMGDIQPYRSMVTGEIINSRSRHREHLRERGLVEVGNETKYVQPPQRKKLPPGLKQTIIDIANAKL